ncbi:hypothetical protein BGX26_008441, partial [Mortierella sp. AD094]
MSSYWSTLKTLKDTMKKATIAYNNNRLTSTFKHHHAPRPHHHAPRRPPVPPASTPAPEPSSMDLDSMRLRKITAEEKQRRRNEGLCLYCGELCKNRRHHLRIRGKRVGLDPLEDWILGQVYATSPQPPATRICLLLPVTLSSASSPEPIRVTALLDSGAQKSFIDAEFVQKYRLPTKTLSQPLRLNMADGNSSVHGLVTAEVS